LDIKKLWLKNYFFWKMWLKNYWKVKVINSPSFYPILSKACQFIILLGFVKSVSDSDVLFKHSNLINYLLKILIVSISNTLNTIIVLKLGPVIDSVRVLNHWVNGRTIGSLVEPHERIELNQLTRLCHSVFIMKILYYIIWFYSLKKSITLIKSQKN